MNKIVLDDLKKARDILDTIIKSYEIVAPQHKPVNLNPDQIKWIEENWMKGFIEVKK